MDKIKKTFASSIILILNFPIYYIIICSIIEFSMSFKFGIVFFINLPISIYLIYLFVISIKQNMNYIKKIIIFTIINYFVLSLYIIIDIVLTFGNGGGWVN